MRCADCGEAGYVEYTFPRIVPVTTGRPRQDFIPTARWVHRRLVLEGDGRLTRKVFRHPFREAR